MMEFTVEELVRLRSCVKSELKRTLKFVEEKGYGPSPIIFEEAIECYRNLHKQFNDACVEKGVRSQLCP